MGRLIKPYGAMNSKGRYEEFIAARGWKYNRLAYCLHWISHGRRCRCYDNKDHYDWMDHTSGYTRETEHGKERMLMCQPYGLNHPETLIKAAEEFNLDYEISGRGWYGHGTVTIILMPHGQRQRESERAMAAYKAKQKQIVPVSPAHLDKILTDWDE